MAESMLPQERPIFYVYVIFRPDGRPCYVGKGKGRRDQHHARFSHNRHLKHIFAKAGGSLPTVRIHEHLTDDQACAYELALIAAIGRLSLGTGPLVNLCDGGDGRAGSIRTEEQCRQFSVIRKGKKHTPEALARMREVKLGVRRSEESKAKQSATITGRKRPEHSAALKGRPRPEVRARQLGRKCPEHSTRMTGNKNSLGKNLGNSNAARITESDVRAIKDKIAAGWKQRRIAAFHNVSQSRVSAIATGQSRSNVT